MSRSASSSGRVASTRSMSRSVTADIRRAVSAQPRMPSAERSLVYANPRRCSSMTRMPTPRSPRAMTDSIAPSLISTDPDWASRRNTSPVAPVALSASRAASTVASFVSRSLIRRPGLAGGTGERGVREPRVPRGPATRRERSERRGRRGGCGERAPPNGFAVGGPYPLGQDPPAPGSGVSLELAAHDDGRDADRWLRICDRRALAVFSASPGRIAEITPDHIDFAHQLRALADQRCAAQRLGELAVADAVALGDFEGEVARYDIDLAATHLLHEHAVLHAAQNLSWIGCASGDHRVGHAADRQITERLAPRVSALGDPELFGVLPVREIRAQHAFLDEDGAARRRAFVVHRGGAALVGIG